MASPLLRRLPRQLKDSFGRYLGVFLLMVVSISFTSGFLMAASSIEKVLDGVRDTYNVEDGRFTTNFALSQGVVDQVEQLGVCVYANYASDADLKLDANKHTGADASQTVRLCKHRDAVDLAVYCDGRAPQAKDEIALDRVYAAHHAIEVGDTVTVSGKSMTVSGICTLADYQALFESNSDFVFNAQTFTVSEVTPAAFSELCGENTVYTYSFVCNDRSMSAADRSDLEEDIADVLSDAGVVVSDFIDADANQAIGYAAEDIVGDQLMWTILLMLIIVIMGFVFVVTTSSTIEAESSVIGTLLASGYRKSEIVIHYLILPVSVGAAGALLGCAIGLTALSEPMRDLYYNSYSLPPYVASWDWMVFAKCVIVPIALLAVITLGGLLSKMRCTPLQFLRHEIMHTSAVRVFKLPARLGFTARFRLRVFFRNIPSFATLFCGITFASLLLVFGLCMLPCVQNYAKDMKAGIVAEHLYTLKSPLELDGTHAQRKAAAAALKLSQTVDVSQIDTDKVADKLADIIADKARAKVEDTLKDSFDADALARAVIEKQGTGKIAGIDVADLAAADPDDPFADIDTDDIDIAQLVDEGILTTSKVDLTDCGLGVVDLVSFDADDIDRNSFKVGDIDFTGISKADVGLDGVDLGGLSLKRFFVLAERADDVDDSDDAHPYNSKANSAAAIAQAEHYTAASLDIARKGAEGYETLSVYGIQEGSSYWDVDVADGKVVVGRGLADKYGLKAGDTFTLHDKYAGKDYSFTVDGTYGTLGNTSVYMAISKLNGILDEDGSYFNGYASDSALKLDGLYVAQDLTPSAMDKICAQMEDSMGDIMFMMSALAAVIFVILMYLLTKVVIERASRDISYLKVFGYRDAQINKLYVRSITITVVLSLIASLPLIMWVLTLLIKVAFMRYTGNFTAVFEPSALGADVALGLACYVVVAFAHMRRIKRVPLSLALKVQE